MRGVSLPNLRGGMAAALKATGVVLFAVVVTTAVSTQPLAALAIPAVVIVAIISTRWPEVPVAGILLLCGTHGSMQAFGILPAAAIIDLLLVSLWVSLFGSYMLHIRHRPMWVWPGMALTILFLLISFLYIFSAVGMSLGVLSFKYSAWYLMCVPLLAFAGWPKATYERISAILLLVAFAVGAYAVFRLIVGPAGAERDLAYSAAGAFNTIDGELSLVGSFPNRHELAFFAACAVPFGLAGVLLAKGTVWKGIAALTVGLCFAAAYGTDVRAALPAIAAGCLVVAALNLIAGRGRGTALAQTAIAGFLAVVAGAAMFTVVVGDNGGRYGAILSPEGDQSYEQHLTKWRAALEDMEGHPFGLGLATAGRIQEEGGAGVLNAASYGIDSSYLKIAYEQGFAVLALFVIAMFTLLIGLARRAVRAREGPPRQLAIGACGALAAAMAMFVTGQYLEGLGALFLWVLIGAAVGALLAEQEERLAEDEQEPGVPDESPSATAEVSAGAGAHPAPA